MRAPRAPRAPQPSPRGRIVTGRLLTLVLAALVWVPPAEVEFLGSARVAAALEWRLKPDAQYPPGLSMTQEVGTETKHVGVVVPARHPRHASAGAECRTDPGRPVCPHRHADTCAADEDSPPGLPRCDSPGYSVGIVRIVHALGGLGPQIHHAMTQGIQVLLQRLLEPEAPVVCSNGNTHAASPPGLPFLCT